MKRMMIVMALLFFGFNSFAQMNTKLVKAIEQLRMSMIEPSKQQLEKLLVDSLSYGHSSGKIDSKQTFIETLVSGNSDFVIIDITNQSIQIFKKTGIVRHNLSGVTNDGGKPGVLKLHVLTIWVKQRGKWLLASRQAVKVT